MPQGTSMSKGSAVKDAKLVLLLMSDDSYEVECRAAAVGNLAEQQRYALNIDA